MTILKKMLIIIGVAMAVTLLQGSFARAHVLLRDVSGQYSAILHIAPNDDPVAGQISTLHFSFSGTNDFSLWDADVLIQKPQYDEVKVPATIKGNSMTADYTFPSRGVYTVALRFREKQPRANEYAITTTVRVTRGLTGQSLQPQSPAWAKSGLILSAWALTGVGLTIWSRRHSIVRNSRS